MIAESAQLAAGGVGSQPAVKAGIFVAQKPFARMDVAAF